MSEAQGGGKNDYSFGQVAIRENICSFEHVKECLDIQSKLRGLGIEPKKLGEILIEKGYLTPEQAVKVAKLQTQVQSGSPKVAIPGYELISKIGQGAMGSVYKAKQLSMDRVVAIKVLSTRYANDRTFVERFVREARAVAKLSHENIISGIDVGEASGLHYFVMEYVDGAPVTTIMKREGRIDERRCLQIGHQVAKALAHAHKHGIVHRDIKPENIMMTSAGNAKLCDLGLAKQTKGDSSAVTMDGTSVGTPNYISPEQARGEDRIDIRTDIYSLGASLYHMSTGTTPFSGPNPMVVMTKHVTEFPDPPRKRCPSLTEGFSNFVMKMMQKHREDRHQDPDGVIADIQALLNGGLPASPGHKGATHAPRPSPATPAPRTRPPTHHAKEVFVSARSSSIVPLAIVAGVVVAGVIGFLAFSDMGSQPANPTPPSVKPNPVVVNPMTTPVDPAERARREIQSFRELIDVDLVKASVPDRFTSPYATIQKRVEHYKSQADFVAQKAWSQELDSYTTRVNEMISQRVWAPIKGRADDYLTNSQYALALKEISSFEEVYRWFVTGEKPTQAGKDYEAYRIKIANALGETFLASKMQAGQAFNDPKRRDEAYSMLDALSDSGTPEQKADIDKTREQYLRDDVSQTLRDGKSAKAVGRIAVLRERYSKNSAVVELLKTLETELKKEAEDAASAAAGQSRTLFAAFRPRFDDALKRRDLGATRRLLYDLYFSSGILQSTFLPAPGADLGLLKGFLDPARINPGETKKVAALAEGGIKFTALRASQYEAARELYVDLRIAALLEELLEQAVEGARAASRDPARFKGYSAVLKDATSAEPAPRKPGELSLVVTVGTAKSVVALSPAGPRSLPEDDIVALARRMGGSEPAFPLKAFYLQLFADRKSQARDQLDKLTTPEARLGTERYADQFKGMTSSREEDEAKRLFAEAWDLIHKKHDNAGGVAKFKDLLARYAHTDHMKGKGPFSPKTRLEIAQEYAGPEGKPKGARPGLKDVFATADFRDLGRGRYEVTYAFKDDREMGMFATVDGQINASRIPGGVQMIGNGIWCWSAPLKGNATIEATFRAQGDGAVGLALHAEGNRAGYLAAVDIPFPGGPADIIFRMPIGEGPAVQQAIIAQGGTGLQVQRGIPQTATFTRDGTRLRFTLGKGQIEADHPQYTSGKPGIGLIQQTLLLEKVKITGEIDPAWIDAEIKRVEANPPK